MRFVLALLLVLSAAGAAAQTSAPTPSPATSPPNANARSAANVVLAENKYAKLTLQDYESELLRLPPDMRPAFGTDPKRVSGLLDNLLLMKSLAAIARENAVDKEVETQRRIVMEIDRLLAQIEIQKIEAEVSADFESKQAQFTQRARELYVVDRKKYEVPAEVLVSHILFDTKTRGDEGALAAAREARAKIIAGADFSTLASQISDDPGTKPRGGHLDWFGEGRMDPTFTKAAFALAKPGDVSEPVKTPFGYHLIKLVEKRPARERSFEEVKPEIMAQLRAQYVNNLRDEKLGAIRRDPGTKVNEAEIEKLVKLPPATTPK